MKEITTVGVDLAKSVFTVHGMDAAGHPVLHKTVQREKLMGLVAGLLQARCRGRLTNWDRARGWLWWPERLNDALTSRPVRDLQSVLSAISQNTCRGGSP